jgi:acyl-coenzyme A synthetase/AMP-(fatty) acid ligase
LFIYRFTSGTTGGGKVLLSTHSQVYENSLASARAVGVDETDRQLAAISWPSNLGMRFVLRAHVTGAAFVAVALSETRAELASVLRRYGVTRMWASPWQLRRLMQSPEPDVAIPPLRSVHVIGSAISPAEIESLRVVISPNILIGYGCNEIGSLTMLLPGQSRVAGCVGRVLPGVELRVETADGRTAKPGEIGDLGWRSTWMSTGYAENPSATRERFRNGWFFPGDAGYIDADGLVYLRGRTQDVINYGGLKIWPSDVEEVLRQHPDILDAALVGVPDPMAGQAPVAFIVPRQPLDGPLPAGLADEALKKFCQARLDATRVPPTFIAVAEIPRNTVGKIERDVLAAAFIQLRDSLDSAGF